MCCAWSSRRHVNWDDGWTYVVKYHTRHLGPIAICFGCDMVVMAIGGRRCVESYPGGIVGSSYWRSQERVKSECGVWESTIIGSSKSGQHIRAVEYHMDFASWSQAEARLERDAAREAKRLLPRVSDACGCVLIGSLELGPCFGLLSLDCARKTKNQFIGTISLFINIRYSGNTISIRSTIPRPHMPHHEQAHTALMHS